MKAIIIAIGDELLIGQVINTNAAFLARELDKLGIVVVESRVVKDESYSISKTLDECILNSDLILLTGGIGPTNDDITKSTLAKYFDSTMKRDESTLSHITWLLKQRGIPLSELNKSQADVPVCAELLPNLHGTAPGMLFEKDGCKIISLPGVPYEMESIFMNQVVPLLQKDTRLNLRIWRTCLTTGIAESVLADKLHAFERNLPEGFALAYLPSPGIVKLRLSGSGINMDELNNKFKDNFDQLKLLVKNELFGFDNDLLEVLVGKLLKDNKLSFATAESCTGGAIASMITSIGGASEYFLGGCVAYSNEAKISQLNVSPASINENGAVSRQVVEQMCQGAINAFNSDFAVSTSGIAGPTGGSKDKPVGTTWIGVRGPIRTISQKYMFGEDRGRTVRKASITALNMLRREILYYVEKRGLHA